MSFENAREIGSRDINRRSFYLRSTWSDERWQEFAPGKTDQPDVEQCIGAVMPTGARIISHLVRGAGVFWRCLLFVKRLEEPSRARDDSTKV